MTPLPNFQSQSCQWFSKSVCTSRYFKGNQR